MSRAKVFGEEKAKEVKAHGEELKDSGVKYLSLIHISEPTRPEP